MFFFFFFLENVVADRDLWSRYCGQSESEYNHVNRNGIYVDLRHCDRQEPRLEIARSDVVAERMRPMIVDYIPISRSKINSLKYKFFEVVSLPAERERLEKSSNETRGRNILNTIDSVNSDKETKERSSRIPNYRSIDAKPIVKLVDSIDSNIPSLKTRSSALSHFDFNVSTKYNLDSTNMSLLYSLTPSVDLETLENIDQTVSAESRPSLFAYECKINVDHSTLCSREKKCFECKEQQWEERMLAETSHDCIWLEDSFDSNENYEFADNLTTKDKRGEIYSNLGSDMLERSADTGLQSMQINNEMFQSDISDTANEIIAQLDANDIYAGISCLVAEIFERVCTLCSMQLSCQRNGLQSSISSSPSLSFSRTFSTSTLLSVPKDEQLLLKKSPMSRKTSPIEDPDGNVPVFVVREIVHHLIDADDISERNNLNITIDYSFKKAKNSANVELKETGNTIDGKIELFRVEGEINNSTIGQNREEAYCRSTKDTRNASIVDSNDMDKSSESTLIQMPPEAIVFEFRTIAKSNSTNVDDKTFELNFRVEKNQNTGTILNDGRADTVQNSDVNCSHVESVSSNPSPLHYKSTNSDNSSESNDIETELLKLSELCDLIDTSKPCELCAECIYCTISHDQERPLPPIDEVCEDTSMNLQQQLDQFSNEPSNEKAEDAGLNDTCTCLDANENGSDKEFFKRDLENSRNRGLSKFTRLNSDLHPQSSSFAYSEFA